MEYFVAALAFLFIPLWFGSMLYLFIKDDDAKGAQTEQSPGRSGEQGKQSTAKRRGS